MTSRYLDGTYAEQHPLWHADDAPGKADEVAKIIDIMQWRPHHVIDIGSGTGDVLHALQRRLTARGMAHTIFDGWDISKDAITRGHVTPQVRLHLGQPSALDTPADLVLCLDVAEHVLDDVDLLRSLSCYAPHAIVRLPLDLSMLDVVRPHRLQKARHELGHLHVYTARLARDRLKEAGHQVLYASLVRGPYGSERWPQKVTGTARTILSRLAPEATATALGGFSLIAALATGHCPTPKRRA